MKVVAVLFILAALGACSLPTEDVETITARIVDAQQGRPLETGPLGGIATRNVSTLELETGTMLYTVEYRTAFQDGARSASRFVVGDEVEFTLSADETRVILYRPDGGTVMAQIVRRERL